MILSSFSLVSQSAEDGSTRQDLVRTKAIQTCEMYGKKRKARACICHILRQVL